MAPVLARRDLRVGCRAPDAPVHLFSDTVAVADYLREQVSDVAIDSWDLERAVGADETLDSALVEAV
ncbi:MAG: hypothetical protein V4531_01135 [Actinomycetota bacterium]